MSSLGDLYFALGLDDKKFNEAIEAAKKRISELSADISINLNVDAKKISEQVLKEIKSTTNTGIEVKTKVDTSVIENLKNLIKESREEVKKLEAEFSSASGSNQALIKSKLETARKRLSEQEHKLTTYSVKEDVKPKDKQIKLELDQESLTKVKEQLSLIEKPIVTKISVEYDTEKFQAVETAMKNFGQRISGAMNGGMNTGSSKQGGSSKQKKGVGGWLDRISDVLLDDEGGAGNGAGNVASNIGATSEGLERLTGVLDGLNKQLESLSKKTESMSKKSGGKKRSVLSDDEEQARRTLSQLQRLEEGIRRWQNVRARIEDSNVDKDSGNYKKAISLIEQYIAKLEEAKKMAGSFSSREMIQMLGQTSTGEIAKAGRLIAKQKTDEQTVKSDLAREQAQIQRLEEGIRRIQNVKAKISASGVNKDSENYRAANAILDKYIDKLENAKRKAGDFSKREMAGLLGQNLSGEIAEVNRLISEEKKLEQSRKNSAKSAAQREREEINIKKAKIQLQTASNKLSEAQAKAETAALNRKRASLRVDKERISLSKRLSGGLQNTSNWASQLNTQIGSYFSIYSLERFARTLYTIGGEFQKQQIALQSMIGDAEKADAIFSRIKTLSVKSPFQFSELASYTKQMSAYGIEYNELYNTTKRLADISAGVGVDMSRLILAYGQVRSAEVLRGQELRQFTEAGIPLVQELADRLSEVRGEAVKVGEVFEAISKRQISFDMVKDVLFSMTDPGGRFFETQERLAKSLAGQWSNLKDAWDIMIADIANGSNGVLSNVASTLSDILRVWRDWLPALGAVTMGIGTLTASIGAVTIATKLWSLAISSNPIGLAVSAILGIAGAIGGWVIASSAAEKSTEQLNSELEIEIQKWNENRENALRYIDVLQSSNTTEERRIQLYEELLKLYPKIFENMKLEEVLLSDSARLKTRINELTAEEQMSKIDKEIQKANEEIKKINQAVKRETHGATIIRPLTDEEKQEKKKQEERIKELEAEKADLQKIIDRDDKIKKLTPDSPLRDYIEIYKNLGKAVKILRQGGVIGEITNPKDLTTTLEYYNQLSSLLSEEEGIMKKFAPSSKEYKEAAKYASVYRKAISAIGGVWDTSSHKGSADEQAKLEIQSYIDSLKRELSEQAQKWNMFKDLMDATGDRSLSFRIAFNDSMEFVSPFMKELKVRLEAEARKFKVDISLPELLKSNEKQLMLDSRIPEGEREKIAKSLGALIEAYHSENKKLKDETIKDYIDIINASKDFATRIDEIERNLRERLATLESIHGKDSPLYKKASEEAIRRAEEDKTKIRFEEFKKSSDWVKVFDDLDRVSNATLDEMTSKITEFAKQAHLSEEVTKQLVEAMRKLREESIERNPFKVFEQHFSNISELKKINDDLYRVGKGTSESPFRFMNKKEKDEYLQEEYSGLNKSAQGIIKKFDAVAQAANMLGEVFSYLGSDVLTDFANILGGAMSGATQGAGIAKELIGAKAGVWGAVAGAGLSLLSSVFAMHDNALQREIEASEAREKAISNIASNLEQLLERTMGGINTIGIDGDTKAYFEETLSRYSKLLSAIDLYNKEGVSTREGYEAYLQIRKLANYSEDTINTIREAMSEDSYYDAQLAALKARRDEVNHQMDLEEGKKKKNDSKIEDYKKEIRELNDEIEYFARDMAEKLYGIDFKDWANKLAESLVNAWATGEDAVLAYKNTVTDILRDLGVSIISQKIIEPMLNDTMEQFLAQFAKDNGVLTDSSMKILSGMYDQAEYAASATEAYLEGLKKMGIDLSDTSKETSGGLSKGIESVTEDTANLLASYLNAIRQDVSIKRTLIEQLIVEDIPQMSIIAQAQLTQLNIIAANTLRNADAADRIYDLVNRVVDKSGNRLKV